MVGPEATQPTSVYRYYDRAGVLIYVGITKQGTGRNAQHNAHAEWWPFVASQEVEHHATRSLAMERERDLIRRFSPPFNKQHNRNHEVAYKAYNAMPAIKPCGLMGDEVRKRNRRLPLAIVGRDPEEPRRLWFTSLAEDYAFARRLVVPKKSCLFSPDLASPSVGKLEVATVQIVPFVRFSALMREGAEAIELGAGEVYGRLKVAPSREPKQVTMWTIVVEPLQVERIAS